MFASRIGGKFPTNEKVARSGAGQFSLAELDLNSPFVEGVATEGRRGSVGRPSTMPLRVAHLSSSATNTTPHHFYKKGNSDRVLLANPNLIFSAS